MTSKSLLPDAWSVPEVFRTRVRQSIGRQRVISAEGHLLLVLHEPPRPDERHRRARLFWRAPDGAWQSNNLGPGIAALEKHLSEYNEAIEKLDQVEERAELADDYLKLLREISPLRRAAGNMSDAIRQAHDLLSEGHELVVCGDQAYHVYRAAELLQVDTKIALDCAMAKRAEEQAKSSYKMALAAHRLNVLAAVFLPIATVSSIFGMNLAHGLDARLDPWLFWLVLLAGIMCGVFLKAAIMDKPVPPRRDRLDEYERTAHLRDPSRMSQAPRERRK